ncbi:TPA: TetR/AcrR family transcriptional regulator [Stenotrophomonas maltophilia]|uniref:TetR/AcrR family transcriptional regulator n=1 Tax=Stenotrophomonas TaxID=40323 RepID=UPI000D1795DA|nr:MULTISPECIES: TetR/AcrR family transcriptional regulator [unclassified Stenotrophomonas]PTA72734.1 TetR family transcriptional regulator [Stenotrophomonas sp. Nf1]PTA82441.1 TetR family transcriptional regulator [Stenotrophomonas sp. Nf4]
MARPRSDARKAAILAAATEVIAAQGLGAATASIAQAAEISHGSLFTYFKTKAELFNELYLALKVELSESIEKTLPPSVDLKVQMYHIWSSWMSWGVAHPQKLRALAQLSVSDQITSESRQAAMKIAEAGLELVRNVGAMGALKNLPPAFVNGVLEALAATTIGFMSSTPDLAEEACNASFEAIWRALT